MTTRNAVTRSIYNLVSGQAATNRALRFDEMVSLVSLAANGDIGRAPRDLVQIMRMLVTAVGHWNARSPTPQLALMFDMSGLLACQTSDCSAMLWNRA